jgi:predicted exporter
MTTQRRTTTHFFAARRRYDLAQAHGLIERAPVGPASLLGRAFRWARAQHISLWLLFTIELSVVVTLVLLRGYAG